MRKLSNNPRHSLDHKIFWIWNFNSRADESRFHEILHLVAMMNTVRLTMRVTEETEAANEWKLIVEDVGKAWNQMS